MGHIVLTFTPPPINLNNVLVFPQLKENVLSLSQLTKDDSRIFELSSSNFKIKEQKKGKIPAIGRRQGDLYSLDFPNSASFARYLKKVLEEAWHAWF